VAGHPLASLYLYTFLQASKDFSINYKADFIGWTINNQLLLLRTRLQPIRTAGEITATIRVQPVQSIYLYQKLSQKARELFLLGMSYNKIAKTLKVSKNTIIKACKAKRS